VFIESTTINNSGPLTIGYFYPTNELSGPIVEIISSAVSGAVFTNINVSGAGSCPP
jgi:hypothetical protein